jgi:hypothetical protein
MSDADMWEAKRKGKLVVKSRDRDGLIYYGQKANEEAVKWKAEHPDEPIPDLLVIDVPDEHWEAFAERYQLHGDDAGDG